MNYEEEYYKLKDIIMEIKDYVDSEIAEFEDNEDYEIDFYNMECLQDKIQTLINDYNEGIRK